MDFNISVSGESELVDKLSTLTGSLLVWPEEMSKTGDLVKAYLSNQVYASQGTVLGAQWAPLSAAYSAAKVKKYPGKGTLVASGEMMQSYYTVPTDLAVTIMAGVDYAQYHQTGTSKMPQRLLFALNDTLIAGIEAIFTAGIEARLNI
jgi:phage gpG-like protein